MNPATEKKIVLYCLNNVLKYPSLCDLQELYDWFDRFAKPLFGIDIESLWRERYGSNRKKLPRHYKTILKLLEGEEGELIVDNTVSAIVDAFHISPKYHDILALRIYMESLHSLGGMLHSQPYQYSHHVTASMAGLSIYRYEKLFASIGELIEKGLFKGSFDFRGQWNIEPTETLKNILYAHCETAQEVRRTILGKPLKATLNPNDYDHIAGEYAWIKNLLANAIAKKEQGVNILVYGKPGTGKSELAKSLCREFGASLFSVSSGHSEERSEQDRRSDLAAALCLVQANDDSVLLMDEAEDVFDAFRSWSGPFGMSFGSKPSKSKLFFNNLLETNAVPVIWISNSIRGVDPGHLRRFAFALNLESPDESVQARIWAKSAKKNKVKLSKTKIDELVGTYDLAPAIINASVRAATLSNDESAIEKTVDSLQTAMYGHVRKKEKKQDVEFSTALLNCDTDLENLAGRILELSDKNFSLCLYGASGTGKSAYARYLADRMKMKVLHKRASDMLSPYVGMTEHYIAEAFAEAKRKNLLLVFDEADSFLQDRRGAHRSWEVSLVNEMLTQMENHTLPFICTTNLMDDLDRAALRRFTFKVKYDYLTESQVRSAFLHFFGMEPAIKLNDLTHLAPGDFAVVAKRAKIGGVDDHRELVKMLRQEQAIKDVKENYIGFVTNIQ